MRIVALFLLSAATVVLQAQEVSQPYTIKVDVGLVALNVKVTDSKHVPVAGLNAENFVILEDGASQSIKHFSRDDVSGTIGLVIDNSSSMRSKRNDVVDAALVFARSVNPSDELFIVNFNEHVWFGLPPGMLFTHRHEQLEAALSTTMANGMTALYDAVCAGLERLQQSEREKKILIVISDGGDNASKHQLSDVIAMVGQPEATIYTLDLYDENDRDNNPSLLKRLASISGGQFFRPTAMKEIIPTLQSIAHEMGSQYTVTYKSSNPRQDGKFRSVRVLARTSEGRNLIVRTRKGYYANGNHRAEHEQQARNR